MNRKWETLLLVVLGLLIIGAVVYNARVMSRIYMVENGLDQDNKVCKARILPNQYDISIKQGEKVKMNLVVANEGNFIWMKGGSQPVHLSYHLLDEKKKVLVYDNPRFELPHDIRPDSEIDMDIKLGFKQKPGTYIIELDLVQEGVTWFGEKGSPTTLVKLHIEK